jgi:cell wall-associated NlpC family hydrolase
MTPRDPRLTPARADFAAAHLQGEVVAARFVEGWPMVVAVGTAPLRAAPRDDAPLLTEALRGERVTVYEDGDGWAWLQLADGYVGWLPSTALALGGAPATHLVAALRTLVFPGASIKLPPVDSLPLGARVAVAETGDGLARLADGGVVPAVHLRALATAEPDFVAVAERFVGVPYLWGGKTALGIDCSGLVQVALGAAGIAAPRDTDMQQAAVGRSLGTPAPDKLERGDLVFWRGHVAIAQGGGRLVHANAHHMAVATEDAAAAIARIAAAGSAVVEVRRP